MSEHEAHGRRPRSSCRITKSKRLGLSVLDMLLVVVIIRILAIVAGEYFPESIELTHMVR